MRLFNKSGLFLPIKGEPAASLPSEAEYTQTDRIGLLGVPDFPGLQPSMMVQEGDQVQAGQLLWTDRKNPALRVNAPVAGTVSLIDRGARRILKSLCIERDANQEPPAASARLKAENPQKIRELLIDSGLWTSFRERPYDKVPQADSAPIAILVTAADLRPLAFDPAPLIHRHTEDFVAGLEILLQLTEGEVLVSELAHAKLPVPANARVRKLLIEDPYPASLPGLVMHRFCPPTLQHKVWYLDWQDVIAMARLLRKGERDLERYVALTGMFDRPRITKLIPGADLAQVAVSELSGDRLQQNWRIVSGSVLYGHLAVSMPAHQHWQPGISQWLGRYHAQVCALKEGGPSVFANWLRPGWNQFSNLNIFASSLIPKKTFELNTLRHGADRGLIPLEIYQEMLPLEIPVMPLLKALIVGDTEKAQQLGCLELGEEDLACCTFACPSKYDYSAALRANLDRIEREG
ncbi:MAG: NADH:ubiquinone reductase (Na(+)-transporting) subunit A [Gammaproteobacteria bacterium]